MAAHDHGSHVPDEPKTPMWLPALGALFFLLAGIWYASRPSEVVADPAANAEPPPTTTAASAAAPQGAMPPPGAMPQGAVPAPQPRREMPGHEGHGH